MAGHEQGECPFLILNPFRGIQPTHQEEFGIGRIGAGVARRCASVVDSGAMLVASWPVRPTEGL